MNKEAQTTKQAPMPTVAKAYELRDAHHLFVVLLKRPFVKPGSRAFFGSSDISSVWNKGRLAAKTFFCLLKPHYLEERGQAIRTLNALPLVAECTIEHSS